MQGKASARARRDMETTNDRRATRIQYVDERGVSEMTLGARLARFRQSFLDCAVEGVRGSCVYESRLWGLEISMVSLAASSLFCHKLISSIAVDISSAR